MGRKDSEGVRGRETDIQPDSGNDRRTEAKIDRQTDKQTDSWTDKLR